MAREIAIPTLQLAVLQVINRIGAFALLDAGLTTTRHHGIGLTIGRQRAAVIQYRVARFRYIAGQQLRLSPTQIVLLIDRVVGRGVHIIIVAAAIHDVPFRRRIAVAIVGAITRVV